MDKFLTFSSFRKTFLQIGSGPYSVVFKGIRKTDGLVVAIKVVNRTSLTMVERENLRYEALLLLHSSGNTHNLQHKNILPLLDVFEDV